MTSTTLDNALDAIHQARKLVSDQAIEAGKARGLTIPQAYDEARHAAAKFDAYLIGSLVYAAPDAVADAVATSLAYVSPEQQPIVSPALSAVIDEADAAGMLDDAWTPTLRAERINAWTERLTAHLNEKYPEQTRTFFADKRKAGARYVRIVETGPDGVTPSSVHAFVDWETGDVYKPAGWKAPAKHVRYRLADDESFARMLAVCDPYGGYLYVR